MRRDVGVLVIGNSCMTCEKHLQNIGFRDINKVRKKLHVFPFSDFLVDFLPLVFQLLTNFIWFNFWFLLIVLIVFYNLF